jgi:4-hydroxybenzoyl-CoA reductase subunit alpha
MGLGQALTEDLGYHKGNLLNPNLLDYRTLTSRQMPPVEVFLIESNDPEGPYGAKECGEGPLLPILPAVANAIHDAVGIRMQELPMTPDRILSGILAAQKAADRTGRSAPASPVKVPANT